mmetsp:Transcript_76530/g.93981  ORF Transcript_76530/g.93981 Transcript_76530/m.93981 type:complete len:183 (+) Transcript_76530:28-576(+)
MGNELTKEREIPDYPAHISIEIHKKNGNHTRLIYTKSNDNIFVYDSMLGHKLFNTYVQTSPEQNTTVLYYDKIRDTWFTTSIKNVSSKPKIVSKKLNINDHETSKHDGKTVLYLNTNKPKIITLINPNNIISTDNGITTMKDLIELYTRDNYKKWSSKTLNCMYIVRKVKDIPNEKEPLVKN